jgi:3-oxoacyl-[acyl-carrier-protein] synthase III
MVITTRDRAKELSSDPGIEIQLISYGYARAPKGHMAMAVVPAAKMALENAGIKVHDLKAIKTHNPFVINDLYFSQ